MNLTRTQHLSLETDWQKQALRNCLYLLRKHAPEGTGPHAGLTLSERLGLPSREEVQAALSDGRRENWWPTLMGPEAIREFLEAGFRDCTSRDYKRWGLEHREVRSWARKAPGIVVQKGLISRGTLDRFDAFHPCDIFNLESNRDRHPLA